MTLRLTIQLPVVLAAALVCTGCGAVDFDVERDVAEQTVAGNPLSGLLDELIGTPIPIDIDFASEAAARDACGVEGAFLTTMQLTITSSSEPSGDSDNFDFLDSVEIFVESAKSGSALPQRLLASLPNVAVGTRTLDFEPNDVNLVPYAEEGARIVSSATGSVPPDDVSFDGRYVVTIDVF